MIMRITEKLERNGIGEHRHSHTSGGIQRVDFATSPDQYRHWRLEVDGAAARLTMQVQEDAPLYPGYELKLNSYDLGVDIELSDAIQRLRFEHPEVGAVVVTSGHDRVFCAGANIRMLAQADHAVKVNFCKFTNETRSAIEDASAHSGQRYICAINGPAAGGGYELALACDHITLIDDGSTTVALPELPLLAVLPGTGGLTRLVDKRRVRRDHADFLCTTSEGVRGSRALEWGLVDELAPRSRFDEAVTERADAFAAESERPAAGEGIELRPLIRSFRDTSITCGNVRVAINRDLGAADFYIHGPVRTPPADVHGIQAEGDKFWPLMLARSLDDAILHMRTNELEVGTWVFHTVGDKQVVQAYDQMLLANADHWLAREITLYLKRTLKRLDVSSRSLIALVEPGSCFVGTLLELVLAADRCYMLDGVLEDSDDPPTLRLTAMNSGSLPMVNGLTRAQARFLDTDELEEHIGRDLNAEAAMNWGW